MFPVLFKKMPNYKKPSRLKDFNDFLYKKSASPLPDIQNIQNIQNIPVIF